LAITRIRIAIIRSNSMINNFCSTKVNYFFR
jgi:hypothetical protein